MSFIKALNNTDGGFSGLEVCSIFMVIAGLIIWVISANLKTIQIRELERKACLKTEVNPSSTVHMVTPAIESKEARVQGETTVPDAPQREIIHSRSKQENISPTKTEESAVFQSQPIYVQRYVKASPAPVYVNSVPIEPVIVTKVIRPSSLPYYQERGWVIRGNNMDGYYRCKFGSYSGSIEIRPGGDFKFFIFDPPEAVLSGSHGACFNKIMDSKAGAMYQIHFKVNSGDVDGGIMAIERVICESLRNGG